MHKQLLAFGLLVLAAAGLASAETIHVPGEQPTLQAGIDAAVNGDTVLVAEGYYHGPGNRDLDFGGKAILVTSETGRGYCFIDCENSGRGFIFQSGEGPDSILSGFTIRNGDAELGGGVLCNDSSPTIENIVIEYCDAMAAGGGLYCNASSSVLDDLIVFRCRVDQDDISDGAGGIHLYSSSPVISNSIFLYNRGVRGGGVNCSYSSNPSFSNCLFAANNAEYHDYWGTELGGWGGAVYGSFETMENCTVAWNDTFYGIRAIDGEGTVINSIIWNVEDEIDEDASVTYSDVEGGWEGEGNIDADPLFISQGELRNTWYSYSRKYFLSQVSAGQTQQSPCVDAGSAPAQNFGLDIRSTRTDLTPDAGKVDLGFHYPVQFEEPDTTIIFGPDNEWVNSPIVIYIYTGEDASDPAADLVFAHQVDEGDWSEYSSATTAVISTVEMTGTYHYFRVRARDTDGNIDPLPAEHRFFLGESYPEYWSGIVTGPGPGLHNPPLVRTSEAEWLAYGILKYGVNVACANLNGEGLDEVLTGPGPGPEFGPHVSGWTLDGEVVPGVSFLAYGTNRYGVNVASGDLDSDGYDEIITGAGPGAVFGPHVRGWNYDNSGSVSAMSGVNFFAYGTPKWGVNVVAGDVDGDGYDEIITGAGPGAVYGPHVRGWNVDGAGPVTPIAGISFFAYGTHQWGVNVACGDLDGDGYAEIISGAGPGCSFGSHVRAWKFDGSQITPMASVNFLAENDSQFGVRVAAGDVDSDGIDEIITGTATDTSLYSPNFRVWSVETGQVIRDRYIAAYDLWMTRAPSVDGFDPNRVISDPGPAPSTPGPGSRAPARRTR